jgi:hypothetical protein
MEKKIIKRVFEIYGDEKYRSQFNNAEKMMKDLLKIALQEREKEEIKWLQSVLDTRHLHEDSKWIIEGRISKLNGCVLEQQGEPK